MEHIINIINGLKYLMLYDIITKKLNLTLIFNLIYFSYLSKVFINIIIYINLNKYNLFFVIKKYFKIL